MTSHNLVQLMDEFASVVNTSPVQDAADKVVRHAGTLATPAAIEVLARLLVLESARRRHAEARLGLLETGRRDSHSQVG